MADRITLITGPMAAGKTTIARGLAERFDRGVHLEGDVYRRWIVTGRAEMAPEASEEALRQLRLRYRLAADAARTYARAGFQVFVEDVVGGPLLEEVVNLLGIGPSRVVVLLPSRDAILDRERGRTDKGYGTWSVQALYDLFETATPRIGSWLDTSALSADASVEAVLAALPRGGPAHGG